MIARAEKIVSIHRPVQSVFEFVLNGANNRLWKRSVIDVRPVRGAPYGVGSKFHQEVEGPEGPVPGEYEITEYEQNKLIGMRVLDGPAQWSGRYEFRQQPAATEVTYALAYEPTENDAAITQQMLGGQQLTLTEEQAASAHLSPQEQRALLLSLEDKAGGDIARSMFVGEGTVRNYVFSGLIKLTLPRIQRWMEDEVSTLDELKAYLEKIA